MNLLTVEQVSSLLNMKKSFIYGLVESGTIPYYRIGRLIRFKLTDIESWMENHRKEPLKANKKAGAILKAADKTTLDIDRFVKKSIEGVKGKVYNVSHGKADRIRGLGKEVKNEHLS